MKESLKAKKTNLERTISRVCGFEVEITVRGCTEFTLSAEGNRDFTKAVEFLSASQRMASVECGYDADCDLSFCFFTVS